MTVQINKKVGVWLTKCKELKQAIFYQPVRETSWHKMEAGVADYLVAERETLEQEKGGKKERHEEGGKNDKWREACRRAISKKYNCCISWMVDRNDKEQHMMFEITLVK